MAIRHFDEKTRKKRLYLAIILTLICTLFTSSGTYLWKLGSNDINSVSSFIFNPYVIFGFLLYGIGSILLIFALSKGDLSILYPIISTGFIWAFLISVFFLKEEIYPLKIAGMLVIITGIIFLGIGANKS
jgi:drug/metabolite transporter (DMT)-like permease